MRRPFGAVLMLFMLPLFGLAAPDEAEQVFELRLFNNPIGKLHVSEFEVQEQGESRQAIQMKMEMTLNRMGQGASVGMDQLEVFDASGKLARFKSELRSSLMPQVTEGTVEGDECLVTQNGREQRIPWDPEAVGQKQMEQDFKELIKKPAGSSMSHKVFVTDFLRTVPTTTTLVRPEPRQTAFGQMNLFQLRTVMDIGSPVVTHFWVDGEGELYEQEVALGPLKMQAVRVDGEKPLPAGMAGAQEMPDIFQQMVVRPDKPLLRPERTRKAVYRLSFTENGTVDFYEDDQQDVLDESAGVVRLQVASASPERTTAVQQVRPPASGENYLSSSALVQADDPQIQAIAAEVVAGESSAWGVAKKLERWVHDNLTEKNLSVALASAKETLQTRQGDCSEHATLLVALLRAAGIPARAAEGLIYANSIGGFGYHMWTEVFIDGKWYDLDATRPSVVTDATRIQMGISDLGHASTGEMAAGLLKYMGKFQIAVEAAE